MKAKIILLSTLFLLFSYQPSKAQAIEIIDAIAGTLLPKISESVKGIIDHSAKRREKDEAKQEVDEKIKEVQKTLIGKLDNEITNLEIIRKIYSNSRRMNSDAGGLSLLTDKTLLSHIIATDVIETKRVIAIQYKIYWEQILSRHTEIKNLDASSLDPNLHATLQSEIEAIDDAIRKIKTINGFKNGTLTFSQDLKLKDANDRITAMDVSTPYIDDIKSSVEKIALIIDTRLNTYVKSFKKLKEEFQ